MPTTPNLGITHIEQNQSSKEVTANAAFDALDESENDTVDLTITGNTTVSSTDYTENIRLHLTGTPAADFTLTVPDTKRKFVVDNATGKTATVQRTSGGASVTVGDGENRLLMNTGADIIAVGAVALPVSDGTEIVKGSADATKRMRFEVDGLTASTTRVLTVQDKDGTVALTGDIPNFAGARAYNSAAISVATGGAGTVLTLDSERYDTDAFHSTVSQTSRLTVPAGKGGKYRITGNVRFAANATGERRLEILLNGTTVIAAQSEQGLAALSLALNVTCDYDLAATDYVELRAYQDSGGALNVETAGNLSPEFSIGSLGSTIPAFKGAMPKKTANQSIANSTDVAVSWDAAEYDTSSFWAGGNPTRLTVPSGVSRVRLTANVEFASSAGGWRNIWIYKNGVTFVGSPYATIEGNNSKLNLASPVLTVAAGDYFEVFVRQTSGAAINLLAGDNSWAAIEVVE